MIQRYCENLEMQQQQSMPDECCKESRVAAPLGYVGTRDGMKTRKPNQVRTAFIWMSASAAAVCLYYMGTSPDIRVGRWHLSPSRRLGLSRSLRQRESKDQEPDYHRVMITAKPSTQLAHEPDTPQIEYPRGGIRVCLQHGQSRGARSTWRWERSLRGSAMGIAVHGRLPPHASQDLDSVDPEPRSHAEAGDILAAPNIWKHQVSTKSGRAGWLCRHVPISKVSPPGLPPRFPNSWLELSS